MSEAVEQFIAAFFGVGNDLEPEALATWNPSLAEWLEGRIAALRRSPLAPALLPRRKGSTLTWYGLAHSARDRRELTRVLHSFVGPTYASLRLDRPLDPGDPIDAAVTTFADHAFTVDVLPGEQVEVRRALDLFFELQEVRPQRQVSVSRPLGRLLREFEMAVAAGLTDASVALLGEIESTGQLSAQNIVFLRVRRLAGLRLFREIMQLPELATILSIRRPARVTAALFDALYTTELASFEADEDPAGAVRHFGEQILPGFPSLFRSRQGVQTPSAIKTYALYAASGSTYQDRRLVEQLAESTDLLPAERSYIREIARLLDPGEEPTDTLVSAIEAARRGSFDAAFELARDRPPTAERAELLVRCAIEIDSLEAMLSAQRAVTELKEDERLRITSSRLYAGPWERIERTLGGDEDDVAPTGWLAWFQVASSAAKFDNALEIAERSVVEWTSEALSPVDSRSISELLGQDLAPSSLRRVKDALPYLLQFIDRVADPAQHRGLLDDLSTLLLLDDDPSVGDIAVLVTLIGSLFEFGSSAERRRELTDDVLALFVRVDAASHLDAKIDLFDIILTFAASDASARDAAFAVLLAALQRWRRRVRPDQWLLAQDLAAEVGAADAVRQLMPDPSPEEDGLSSGAGELLRDKKVAIYTLTEAAAERARDFLLRNFEGVAVTLSSDHVASDRLAAMSHSADIFVIATRSAKHAATTFIESQRPPNRPPVYAAGKGSVSLIRAVLGSVSSPG